MTPLKENTLYILLYLRTSPPTPNNYHWALYHHHQQDQQDHHPTPTPTPKPKPKPKPTSGTKYHIKTEGSGSGWIADHSTTTSILTQFLLVGAFAIATIPPGCEAYVDKTLRSLDGCLNSGIEGVTCRVWVLRVLELLMGSSSSCSRSCSGSGSGKEGVRILQCEDLGLLEREVLDWGNEFAEEADRNVQPRPVGVSRICGFDSLQ